MKIEIMQYNIIKGGNFSENNYHTLLSEFGNFR